MTSWELESGLADCRTRLAAAARVDGVYRERARAISGGGCCDREIRGSDLGRMWALLPVRAEGCEVMGEDVKWALGIAVTALVLVAFLPLVPVVLVPGPWKTRGRVRDRNPPVGGAVRAVRFLSGRAEMLLSRYAQMGSTSLV